MNAAEDRRRTAGLRPMLRYAVWELRDEATGTAWHRRHEAASRSAAEAVRRRLEGENPGVAFTILATQIPCVPPAMPDPAMVREIGRRAAAAAQRERRPPPDPSGAADRQPVTT